MTASVRVASVAEIPLGTAREVVAFDRVVAIYHTEQGFFALDGVCPHAGGPLAEGQVRDGVVACPWHGWQYELATGRNCVNPAVQARSFGVRVEGDDVLLDPPAS
ncbi:MAG: Rieske (2Fe-2S) protein [Planctomycetaceae bacterium]